MDSLSLDVPRDAPQREELPESFSGRDDLTTDADLCIICKDGERLYVHRLIMSKWSSVIRQCPGMDSPAHTGDVLDFAVDEVATAWREVLGIVYPATPITTIDWDNVGRLYALADKYAMSGISQRCLAFLLSPKTTFSCIRLRNDYVLKWLAFAAQYHQRTLGKKCMQFIRLNYKSLCRGIDELRSSPEKCYVRDVLATTPEGVQYIIEILQFVVQHGR